MDKATTTTLKAKLQRIWQAHVANARAATPVDVTENEVTKRERIARLEAAHEEWFAYYFPKYAFAQPAPFHIDASRRIIDHPEWYEIRMWSRELAKSTRTMMEVLYLTLVGHPAQGARHRKKYVMLISNSLANATRLLMPYRANLQFNQRIINDYGIQERPGFWQAEEFITRSGVAFRALGAGQSPRGARHEEARPDILLFDDIDTDIDCRNPTTMAGKWRWIEEAAIGTRSISQPTTILFCGNRIARDCCVERASRFADHTDLVNIRDANGLSSWPQKNTEAHIDRVLKQKSYAAQQKEYYNDPVTEGAVFSAMYYKPIRPLQEYSMLVCYTDPSYKSTADYKATVLIGRWQNEYHVLRAYVEQTTTARLIEWHHHIMQYVGGHACYYYIEEVFLQDTIKKEIADAGKRLGRPIPIVGDTRAKPDKYTRIESLLQPLVKNGELFLNEDERHNPGMMMLEQQFLAFSPGSHAHDDGPDAVEGAIWILINKQVARTTDALHLVKKDRNTSSDF
ncbi:phage terminase large subunit [Nemorincola caseinilytica]|uniref:Phage terminase large subunit n=1 Tax=Nemorincola caseinilytica TaxID=2054315 RepID=A0ABP8NFX3_9BACT